MKSLCSPYLRVSVRIFFGIIIFLPFSLFSQEILTDDDIYDGYFFEDDVGITVTGTVQTSRQLAVIEREEIERRNSSDLAALLQETLGINIIRYGAYGNQAGINLRGFDSKRVAFLIDGIPADSIFDGKFDINLIDLNSIERIEVIYGGSDSRFNVSGAMGGVINIITIKKHDPGWRFVFSLSNTSAMPGEYRDRNGQTQSPHFEDLFDTQNYSLFTAYGGGRFSFSANVFANRAQNHFLFTDFAGYTRRKDNNEVFDTGASVSISYDLRDYSRLLYSANFYYGDKYFPSSGFSARFGNQKDFYLRESLMLDVPRAFRDDLAAEAALSWQFDRRDFTSSANAASPSYDASRHDQFSLNAVNRWSWFVFDHLTLRSGIDYRYSYLDSTDAGRRDRHDGGLSLSAEFQPIGNLLFVPSAKAVFSDNNAAIIPKLGILWNVTDSFAIKNNYFRSFKFPDFEELYWSGSGGIGNSDLLPEDGWGADIGFEWRITDTVNLESVFFTQLLQNSIHWFSHNGVWQPENVGEAVFFGADTRINFEIPVNFGVFTKISASFSYKYLRSYLLSFGYTFDSDKRIPYNPEHTIGGSLDIGWGTGLLIISGHYEGIRCHDRANLIILPEYFLLNLTVNQKAGNNLTFFGSARNILNTSYESFYDYPMPGFTLTLGVRLNLELKKNE